MKVIADTLVWSLAFRRNKDQRTPEVDALARLIEQGQVVVLGPVRQELLSRLNRRRFARVFDELELVLICGDDDSTLGARTWRVAAVCQ